MTSVHRPRCRLAENRPSIGSAGAAACISIASVTSAGQPLRQRREDRLDVARQQSRRELVRERVPGIERETLSEELRLAAHQLDRLLELRREHVEVVRLARLAPARLGAREGLGHARDQRLRRRDRVVVEPAHLAQVRRLPAGERLGVRIGAVEQPRDARRHEQRVGLDLERRELVAADVRARPRHGDGGVPAQDREHAPEGVQPPEFLLELLIRGRRRQSAAPWSPGGRPRQDRAGPSKRGRFYQPGLLRAGRELIIPLLSIA